MGSIVYDKLSIINDCLLSTGNKTCLQDDGSPEWIAASNAYERCFPNLLYSRTWKFYTEIGDLLRVGTSTLPGYCDIYEKPADCLHLESVWRTDYAQFVPKISSFSIGGGAPSVPQLNYQIVGDQIHTVAPLGASAKWVKMPGTVAQWPPGFVEALRRDIESLLYQGLNEDADSAKLTKQLARQERDEAAARVDQEEPRRVAFRSGFLEKRRVRRIGWWL